MFIEAEHLRSSLENFGEPASLRMLWWSEHPCRMRHQWKVQGGHRNSQRVTDPGKVPWVPPSISCPKNHLL